MSEISSRMTGRFTKKRSREGTLSTCGGMYMISVGLDNVIGYGVVSDYAIAFANEYSFHWLC
jgi:hypothetical protein